MSQSIVFCTTVKNRTRHLRLTLPQNLRDNPRSKFVVLNYNTDDDLLKYLFTEHAAEIEVGRLIVYTHRDTPVFHMAHAKNMAMRCGMREGADILVTLDADNLAGYRFEDHVEKIFKDPLVDFARPDFASMPPIGQRYNKDDPLLLARGFYGRLAIRRQTFIKMGGYDEAFDTWRGEDTDMLARLRRVGLKGAFLATRFMRAINHPAEVRFAEYPHAAQYENAYEQKAINAQTNTVVNFGKIGCGTVYRYNARVDFEPLPTRVFGIGLQRTATLSLHRAFQVLGYDSLHWGRGEAPRIWAEMNQSGGSPTLDRYYAASDNPIPLFYKQLDKLYPGSKFILTLRDERDWIGSMERLWSYDHNPTRWQWDEWPISNTIHRALYGRTDFDAETMLARYRRHTREVLAHFAGRPSDLLVFNVEHDGWHRLCQFLDEPIPDVPYPHENHTTSKEKYQDDTSPLLSPTPHGVEPPVVNAGALFRLWAATRRLLWWWQPRRHR
jgi:hypothetical protein